jgi:hypothetical protein
MEAAMRYSKLKKLPDEAFRRRTGIQRSTFTSMVKILQSAERKKRALGGKKPKQAMADRLLMTLEYLREYRTYFHIASSYNISESTAYRYIRWIEDTLIKDKIFALPGRKTLLKSDMQFEVVMIDATESPCERPKKNSGGSTPAKRNGIPKKRKSS